MALYFMANSLGALVLALTAVIFGMLLWTPRGVGPKGPAQRRWARAAGLAVLAGAGISVVLPTLLYAVPVALLEHLLVFEFTGELHPDLANKKYLYPRIIEDVRDWDEAVKIVSATIDEPIIFRNLVTPDTAQRVSENILARMTEEVKPFRALTYDMTAEYDLLRAQKITGVALTTVPEVIRENSNLYMNFNPMIAQTEIADIVQNSSAIISHLGADMSFLSNFNRTLAATAYHAASVSVSWAVQMSGKKTWYFWHPDDCIRRSRGWFAPTCLAAGTSEKDLFEQPTYKAAVGPGDVLVFGPLWAHSVVTYKGLNLMVNLRTVLGRKALPLSTSPFHAFRSAFSLFVDKAFFGGLKPDIPADFTGPKRVYLNRHQASLERDQGRIRSHPVEQWL